MDHLEQARRRLEQLERSEAPPDPLSRALLTEDLRLARRQLAVVDLPSLRDELDVIERRAEALPPSPPLGRTRGGPPAHRADGDRPGDQLFAFMAGDEEAIDAPPAVAAKGPAPLDQWKAELELSWKPSKHTKLAGKLVVGPPEQASGLKAASMGMTAKLAKEIGGGVKAKVLQQLLKVEHVSDIALPGDWGRIEIRPKAELRTDEVNAGVALRCDLTPLGVRMWRELSPGAEGEPPFQVTLELSFVARADIATTVAAGNSAITAIRKLGHERKLAQQTDDVVRHARRLGQIDANLAKHRTKTKKLRGRGRKTARKVSSAVQRHKKLLAQRKATQALLQRARAPR